MIRRKTETRGRYDVGVYEVDIDVDMRRDALQFANCCTSACKADLSALFFIIKK
ncbi:MAG: hypothetical protein SOV36_09575 [Anaerostipes faecalis]|nr:hypothetical protein [Anaerostipes faecalis]